MGEDRGGEVIKGTLEMIVLEVLQHKPMHSARETWTTCAPARI